MPTQNSTIRSFLRRFALGDLKQSDSSLGDEAWRKAPSNYLLILATQFFTKLGDALTSTKIILPWILVSIGTPATLIGLLVPIRESGSLIPQVIIGQLVKRRAQRKLFFIMGCVIQALAVLGMVLSISLLSPASAGYGVILFLILFSLARGFCSVSSKDIIGVSVAKRRRGRLNGLSASAAGLISMALGAALFFGLINKSLPLILFLLVGAICFVFATIVFTSVSNFEHEVEGEDRGLQFRRIFDGFNILRTDRVFRRFVIARCLLISSGLAIPYLVMLAKETGSVESSVGLGLLMLTGGIASFIAGPLWGRTADSSSRKLMIYCAMLICTLSIAACIAAYVSHPYKLALFVFLFFLFSLVHEGVRLARKTYVLDIAEGNKRTTYVSVSNSVIGLMLLAIGALSSVLAQYSLYLILILFSVASLSAALLAIKLPES